MCGLGQCCSRWQSRRASPGSSDCATTIFCIWGKTARRRRTTRTAFSARSARPGRRCAILATALRSCRLPGTAWATQNARRQPLPRHDTLRPSRPRRLCGRRRLGGAPAAWSLCRLRFSSSTVSKSPGTQCRALFSGKNSWRGRKAGGWQQGGRQTRSAVTALPRRRRPKAGWASVSCFCRPHCASSTALRTLYTLPDG